jgi:hypothetical protein
VSESDTTPTYALTAAALREVYGGRVDVPLPKAGMVAICRRPDIADAIVHGSLPLPLLKAVLVDAELAGMLGIRPDQEDISATTSLGFIEKMKPETMQFIDRWCCLAAVTPRLVLEEQDGGADALWILEMPLDDKVAIFSATFNLATLLRAGGPAGATFRAVGPGGAPGPDGAAVWVPPVDAPGDAGSGGGA